MKKIIVILGTTSTGKSDIAVHIALKLKGLNQSKGLVVRTLQREVLGEIISADSRQIYKGLNLGTGKITKKEMQGIIHHMLDIANPKKRFDVSTWQKQTKKKIAEIHSRGNVPIICGGTGFYIQSIVDNIVLPEVPPDFILRGKLENKTLVELVKILNKLDPEILKTIDTKNPVRLIRAIEIATELGYVPKLQKNINEYDILQIGLMLPDEVLKKRIRERLLFRIKKGMLKEVENLHKNGLSWKRMHELGLEYRHVALFLQKKLMRDEFIQKLNSEIWQYARRQRQWFKRDKKIKWFPPLETKKIEKEVVDFLKKPQLVKHHLID